MHNNLSNTTFICSGLFFLNVQSYSFTKLKDDSLNQIAEKDCNYYGLSMKSELFFMI